MKILIVLLAIFSFGAMADQEANCRIVEGIYKNSDVPMNEMKFVTLADIFTVTNASVLAMNLDGENLHFSRSTLIVNRQTQIIFLTRRGEEDMKAAIVQIDRTPREAKREQEFYGNVQIMGQKHLRGGPRTMKPLVYNFYCSF